MEKPVDSIKDNLIEQSDSKKEDNLFEQKIGEQLDFLLETTKISGVLNRIKQCEEKTDNDLSLCFKDTLMAINLGLLLLDSTCEKFGKKLSGSNYLKKNYEELKSFTDKFDKTTAIKDVRSMISGNLTEMHNIIIEIKNNLLV